MQIQTIIYITIKTAPVCEPPRLGNELGFFFNFNTLPDMQWSIIALCHLRQKSNERQLLKKTSKFVYFKMNYKMIA